MAKDWNGGQPRSEASASRHIPWAPVSGRPWEPGIEAGRDDLTPYHRPNKRRSFWRRTPQVAHEIMTAPVRCVGPDDDLGTVADIMDREEVGIVPVIDDNRRLLGVITDRDIVVRAFGRTRDERRLMVGDVMTQKIHTAAPDEPIERVSDRMRAHGVQRIPVVAADGKLLGIISLDDLATRTDEGAGPIRSPLSELSDRRRPSRDEVPRGRGTVLAADLMTSPAFAVHLNAPLAEVVSLMRHERIGVVPVVDGGWRLRGVITDRDILLRVIGPGDRHERHDRMRAGDVMTPDIVTADPSDTIDTLLDRMGRHGVHRLPIVEPDDHLLGIVSLEDLARHAEDDPDLQNTLDRITRRRSFWTRLSRFGGMP